MATDNIFATLACCLLAISFAIAQAEKGNVTVVLTTAPALNITTFVTSANSAANTTAVSNVTENTTPFDSTTQANKTFNETTSHTPISESTTIVTPLPSSTSLKTTTPGTHTPAFTALTTPAIQTSTGYNSTPNTTVTTTAYSPQTVNTTSVSKGMGLNISEKSMTIVFSVILGLFAVVLVVLLFKRCKHKFQYLHQPLNNTSDTDLYVADDDTLVISGGLYDGHPIYDNVPTAPADQSQFRLEFLQ
ncbi:uncharacterized protein C1235.01 [Anabas testudineus]|uniref:uncharacterized protein C1235.01 n=1 Tax=Anabas testudineus TaxID=64144 RepID=UPI000E455922|nr:uncharacterized protein C1235.01 [Anabas testudineus]